MGASGGPDAEIDLRQVDRTREALQVRWLDEGTLICTLTNGDHTDLWTVPAEGETAGPAQRLTARGVYAGSPYERDVDPFDVGLKGTVVFASADGRGGGTLCAVDVDAGSVTPVVDGPEGVSDPRLAPGGDELIFITDRWGAPDVAVANTDGTRLTNLTDDRWFAAAPSPSPDPNEGLVAYVANRPQDFTDDYELRVLDRDSGDIRTVAGGVDVGDARYPTWSPDGAALYFASDERGHYDLYRWQPGSSDVERLTGGDTEDSDPRVHPGGDRVAFSRERHGTVDLALLDSRTGDVVTLTDGAGVAHRARWSTDGRLAYVHADYRTPSTVRTLDDPHPSGTPVDRTVAGTSGFRSAAVDPDRVHFESDDGTEIPALVYAPDAGNGAGLVFVHGGPMKVLRNGWNPQLQYFANRGFTVIAPNFRGSLRHGRAHRRAVYGDWAGRPLADVIGAAGHLGKLDGVDANRLGVWGPSYGGYVTLLALGRHPSLFEAGVCFYGTPDYEEYYNDHDDPDLEDPYWEQPPSLPLRLMLKHFGPIATNRDTYVEQSPVHDVADIASPLLVLQGLEDRGVLPSQAETLVERLDRHDKVYEYHTYEGQGHGFTGEAFVDAVSRTATFFEKYLTAPPERP